jgi:L,D-transpeptidase ErfK/SrfK
MHMIPLPIRSANQEPSKFSSRKKFSPFFFNMQRHALLPRWPRCLVLLTLVFALLPSVVCSAEMQSCRKEARTAVDRLRESSPPPASKDEYGNVLATLDEADLLTQQNKQGEAEQLYRLVLLKASILNKKLYPPEASSARTLLPASSPDQDVTMKRKKASQETPAADIWPKEDTSEGSEYISTGTGESGEDVVEEENPVSSSMMVGKQFVYIVKRDESLRKIGARLGVGWRTIARENDLEPGKHLQPGQVLVINTRRIIPKTLRDGILINIPDRTLYLFKDRKLEKTVPVAVGRPTYEDYGDWRTPTGRFSIVSKRKNPTWHVPPSIQSEMKQNRKKVLTVVPPSSGNPLGKYALKTDLSGILIHSTIHPESIYNFASHGCIRVDPKNMEKIFPQIPLHARGEIVYQPVKLAFLDDGRIFIEVHGDIYKRYKKLDEVAKGLIIRNRAQQRVDWDKVRALLAKKSGIPEDVTLEGPESKE